MRALALPVQVARAGLLVVLLACGGAAPPPAASTNPARLQAGCEVPAGSRSLRARVELERGQGTLAVDGQDAGACGVYALTPGPHAVTLRAGGEAAFGVAAVLEVFADGDRYDAFDLHCGVPGSCDTDTLRAWRRGIEADRTRMTDPCAALKVTDVKWESQQLDDVHPKALSLSFTLHVYSRSSGKAPRDPSCPDK